MSTEPRPQTDSPNVELAGIPPSRRDAFQMLAALGIGSVTFQRSLAVQSEKSATLTIEMVQQAEWISGIQLSEADRKSLLGSLNQALRNFESMRTVKLGNEVSLPLAFNPAPWQPPVVEATRGKVELSDSGVPVRPAKDEDLAFMPVTSLARLLRTRQVTSSELVKLYLDRLKRYDPVLHCVVTLTEELTNKQAEHADRELAAGRYRGPLHGIPWVAKDLIAVPGYKTTWGATPYRDQVIDAKATVVQRLEEAGAVLLAKVSLGALAMGDKWFGGMTRSPWNAKLGSSGSSAGSASAVAAGLTGFALGTETYGSIVSPCRQCGTTGLRPTFGRVSRHGCMTLCWSMDKVGPIARSVEDCALVFGAIHGFDGNDPCAVDRPFSWPGRRPLSSLKIGYFDTGKPEKERTDLRVLRELGVQLTTVKLPSDYPAAALLIVLTTEAAAAFDDLTRKGITEGLNSWPTTFRTGQFVPAVEYLRANRIRGLLMHEMDKLFTQVDAYVGGNDLLITNLTGHPTVVMPSEPRKPDSRQPPTSITFTGRLYGETDLLSIAHAFQQATGHHLARPPMAKLVAEKPADGE